MVRLSNILSVESRPFDPDTHALEGEEYIDEAGQRQARAFARLSRCAHCDASALRTYR
jgi:hypothetical protein